MVANQVPPPCYMCWVESGEAAARTLEAQTPQHQKKHFQLLRMGFAQATPPSVEVLEARWAMQRLLEEAV